MHPRLYANIHVQSSASSHGLSSCMWLPQMLWYQHELRTEPATTADDGDSVEALIEATVTAPRRVRLP
jgi:hypothetical protein